MLVQFLFWLTAKRYRWKFRVYGVGAFGTFTYTLLAPRWAGLEVDVEAETAKINAIMDAAHARHWEMISRP